MKYYISTISDVVDEADDNGWETISYVERTAPLAAENGLGIEIAEFCISENMDDKFEEVLPQTTTLLFPAQRMPSANLIWKSLDRLSRGVFFFTVPVEMKSRWAISWRS